VLAQAGQEFPAQIDSVPDVVHVQLIRVQMFQAADRLTGAGFRVGVDLGGFDGVGGSLGCSSWQRDVR
jgi:hypothetical protein